MQLMNDKEFKTELLDILKEFKKICDENGIKYSLYAGSMIGAVRHHGIIPWDDDIDVVLTKENYDKLLSIIDKYTSGRYIFTDNDFDETYYYPFLKMVDTKTYIDEKFKPIKKYGIYIDIFYFTKVPDNKLLLSLFWYKIQFYKVLISGYATRKITNHKFLKYTGKFICKIFGVKRVIKNYKKHISKYNDKNYNRVICNWPCYSLNKEIQYVEDFNDYCNEKFEDENVLIFKNYDRILKNTYGDYMKLPKEEDRHNHGLKGYWK